MGKLTVTTTNKHGIAVTTEKDITPKKRVRRAKDNSSKKPPVIDETGKNERDG